MHQHSSLMCDIMDDIRLRILQIVTSCAQCSHEKLQEKPVILVPQQRHRVYSTAVAHRKSF